MPYYYGGGDFISYILIFISLIVTLGASIFIKINYKKYLKVLSKKGYNGFDVARKILDSNGLNDILVLEVSGELADHYDPERKSVKLSVDVYNKKTVASMAVAAHECGHALQDKEGYKFLVLRSKLVPIVNMSSKLGYIAILIGFLFSLLDLVWVGIALEFLILFFQLVTLPVEFNASKRALVELKKLYLVDKDELGGCKKMLASAAFTYVAGVLSAILEILRLILLVSNKDRRR